MNTETESTGMKAQFHKRSTIRPEAQEQAHSRAGRQEPERYRPAGYTGTVRLKDGGGVIFYTPDRDAAGEYHAIAYRLRSKKPVWHYRFPTRARLEFRVSSFVEAMRSSAAAKARRAAERSAAHTLKVGDVLDCMWGYEQTNVDFYEVTRTTSHGVYLKEIGQEREENGYMSGDCVPRPGAFKGDEFFRRCGQNNVVKIKSYSSASLTPCETIDGLRVFKPRHWTAYH